METSAGVPLISMRPFPVPKWSAWLVSKESSRPSGFFTSYTKSATYLTAPPALVSLQTAHKNPVPNIARRPNKHAGMPAHGQVESATGGQ